MRAAAFARDERGTISVETVILVPLLLWVLAAVHVFWDGYRTSTDAVRSTFTLSDLMSRDDEPLDQVGLDGMRALLDALAGGGRAGGSLRDGPSSLRVSVARNRIDSQTEGADGVVTYATTLVLDFSQVSGATMAPVASIDDISAHVPTLAPGDQLLVVETTVPWSPLFGIGLEARQMHNVAVTRHRFGHRFCWEAC